MGNLPTTGVTPVSPEKKKKAHRGSRGGQKHRKGKGKKKEASAQDDDTATPTPQNHEQRNAPSGAAEGSGEAVALNVEMALSKDTSVAGGPIINMGSIEVHTDTQLGSGSNGTLVFAGKFDGRDVAVKRMLIHFYDIASQETKLLRESDDHPNGKFPWLNEVIKLNR